MLALWCWDAAEYSQRLAQHSPSQSSAQSRVSALLGHHLRKYYLLLLNNRKTGIFLIDKIFLSYANGTEEALKTITAKPFNDRFQSVTFLEVFHCSISAIR